MKLKMQKDNWLTKLYDAVSDASGHLEVIRDYDDEGDNSISDRVNRLTELEKQIYEHTSQIFDLCRKHPLFFEPTPKTHPDWFDSDGDLIPDLGEVKPFDFAEWQKSEIKFNETLRVALTEFFKDTNLKKSVFANAYGVSLSYLSNMLKGTKKTDYIKADAAGKKLGYSLIIYPSEKTAKFVKN